MSFYILMGEEGRHSFYMDDDITQVPAGVRKISDEAHQKFFSGNPRNFKWVPVGEDRARLISVEPEPLPVELPNLTPRQFSRVLIEIGINDDFILSEIEKIEDEKEREIAKVDFLKATSFSRDYPLVDQVAAALGYPKEQVDALWMFGGSF